MSRERILFVTSRNVLYDLVKYNLDKRNYEVSRAATPADLEAIVPQFKPQLVILDHDPTILSDLSTCRLIDKLASLPRPKYIIITTATSSGLVNEASELGIDSLLLEPFTLEDLFEKIEYKSEEDRNMNVIRQGNWIIVSLKGTCDYYFSPRFRQALATICTIGAAKVIIDFSDVDFFAHQNLVPLLTAQIRLQQQGGQIRLVSLNAGMQKLFNRSGILEIFSVYANRAEALRS